MGSLGSLVFIDLGEDVLVYVLSFLEPPDILRFSRTCRDLHKLAFLRIVWTNTCSNHVVTKGYPFPNTPLDDISTPELIYCTNHAYALARRWLAGMSEPRRINYISGTSGTSVSDVRFVPGHDDMLLLTISKVVWSALGIWFIGSDNPQKVCEWSPRGAIFTGFTLNSDTRSEATIAISIHLNEIQTVKILSLEHVGGLEYTLREIRSLDQNMQPMTLMGDLVALTDDLSQTAIWNWRTGAYAILQHFPDNTSMFQTNRCIQVLFAHESVLVVRARNMHLFPFPRLQEPDPDGRAFEPYRPLAQHSFGWVDGECVNVCPFLNGTQSKTVHLPLSILVRGESDDPWASDIHNLELYILDPNPSTGDDDPPSSPYIFPPRLTNKVACLRGSLTCKQILLGRYGTAVWIQPRNRFVGGLGLLADIPPHLIPERTSTHNESLIVAAFPGSLMSHQNTEQVVVGTKVFGNDFNTNWTSFDYDEVGGRIALGSSFGRVSILGL